MTEIVGFQVPPLGVAKALGADAVPGCPFPRILAESRLPQRDVWIVEEGGETAALKMLWFWQPGEFAERRIHSHELDERSRSLSRRVTARDPPGTRPGPARDPPGTRTRSGTLADSSKFVAFPHIR